MTKMQLFIICIVIVLFPATSFSSEPKVKAVWIGTVTMDYTLSNSINKETSDKNGVSRHSLNEDASFRVVIKACGSSAQNLRIVKPDVSYTLTENRFRQARKAQCRSKDDKHTVYYVTPGDSDKEDSSFLGILHPVFPVFLSQPVLSVDKKSKDYAFSVSLNSKPALLVSGNLQSETRYACTNETFIKDVKFAGLDTEPSSSCDSSGRTCTATATVSERILPLIASYYGKYDGGKKIKGEVYYSDLKSIYGSVGETIKDTMEKTLESMKELGKQSPELQKELAEAEADMKKSLKEGGDDDNNAGKKDPDLKTSETLKVSWEFEIEDECDDVIDQLKQDISILRAYASEDVFNKAVQDGWSGSDEGYIYDERVAMEGVRQLKSKWWEPNYKPPRDSGASPKNEGSAKIDMSTDNDCNTHNVEELKADQERKCYPDIIFESKYQHEMMHVRQCQDEETGPEYKAGTPDSYQKFEIEANCVGIGILLGYAKEHCKDRNIKPYEKEYKRICGK
jgi:hypothetical protein